MCNCLQDPCGCSESPELPFLEGQNGQDGKFGGFSGKWKFDTATAGNPASGYLRFDNSTYSAVTTIVINDTNTNGVDYDKFLDSFDNNGSYGRIRLFKEYNEEKHWIGEITNVVDNGNRHTLTVTWIQHNSSFVLDENIVVTFTPKGANGTNGSSAATKAYVLESFIANPLETITTGNNGTFSTVLTLPANTLVSEGDVMIIEHLLEPTESDTEIDVEINNNLLESCSTQEGWVLIRMEVSRITNTVLYVTLTINNSVFTNPSTAMRTNDFMFAKILSVPSLLANPVVFTLVAPNNVPGDLRHIKSNSKIILK
jgi:hypothetical protein